MPAVLRSDAASPESSAVRFVKAYCQLSFCATLQTTAPSMAEARPTMTRARKAPGRAAKRCGSWRSCEKSWSMEGGPLHAHSHDFLVRLDDLAADLAEHPHADVGLLQRQRQLVQVALAHGRLLGLLVGLQLQGVHLGHRLAEGVGEGSALGGGGRRGRARLQDLQVCAERSEWGGHARLP